jgi:hypothetical protein
MLPAIESQLNHLPQIRTNLTVVKTQNKPVRQSIRSQNPLAPVCGAFNHLPGYCENGLVANGFSGLLTRTQSQSLWTPPVRNNLISHVACFRVVTWAGCWYTIGLLCVGMTMVAADPAAAQFPSEQFPSEQFPSEQFPSEQFPSEQFPSEQFPSEQFPSQQFPSQQFPSEQFPSEQFPSEQSEPPQTLDLPSDWAQASFTAFDVDAGVMTGEPTSTAAVFELTDNESLLSGAGSDGRNQTAMPSDQDGDPLADRDEFERFLFQTRDGQRTTTRPALWRRIVSDHRNYYDAQSFRLLAGGFVIGAAFANTQLDGEIQDHFQTSVRGATSDEWSEFLHGDKALGNGNFTLPVFAAAWAAGEIFDESPMLLTTGRWGERSIRSFLVGAPSVMLAQRLTGGSRPGEKDRHSRWLPFQDNNGVSGHSFMAALPFINAAKMTENRWLKAGFYGGSLLGPLSRINDDDHYPSQAALGWLMAYAAASAIDRSAQADRCIQFAPYATSNGLGGMLELQY